MTELKTTSGNWIVKGNQVLSQDNKTIADCENDLLPKMETIANANLTGLAPAMLHALEKINTIVYANVIVAGSAEYFEIRDLCCDLIQKGKYGG